MNDKENSCCFAFQVDKLSGQQLPVSDFTGALMLPLALKTIRINYNPVNTAMIIKCKLNCITYESHGDSNPGYAPAPSSAGLSESYQMTTNGPSPAG